MELDRRDWMNEMDQAISQMLRSLDKSYQSILETTEETVTIPSQVLLENLKQKIENYRLSIDSIQDSVEEAEKTLNESIKQLKNWSEAFSNAREKIGLIHRDSPKTLVPKY